MERTASPKMCIWVARSVNEAPSLLRHLLFTSASSSVTTIPLELHLTTRSMRYASSYGFLFIYKARIVIAAPQVLIGQGDYPMLLGNGVMRKNHFAWIFFIFTMDSI